MRVGQPTSAFKQRLAGAVTTIVEAHTQARQDKKNKKRNPANRAQAYFCGSKQSTTDINITTSTNRVPTHSPDEQDDHSTPQRRHLATAVTNSD